MHTDFATQQRILKDSALWYKKVISYADITENVKYAEYAKKKPEKFGFGNAEIFLNEWNPGIEQKGRLKDDSNIASGFCLVQKTSTDMCMYYDAQINTIYCGLFDFDRHDIHKAYYAFYIPLRGGL